MSSATWWSGAERDAPRGFERPALVVGIGNPLRGDDGFGAAVVEGIERPGVRALAVSQLTPELALDVAQARSVIFVDVRVGGEVGELVASWVPLRSRAKPFGAMSHELEPAALLALVAWLYGAPPPALLVTVGGVDFGLGARLSPSVGARVAQARAWVIAELERGGMLRSASPR